MLFMMQMFAVNLLWAVGRPRSSILSPMHVSKYVSSWWIFYRMDSQLKENCSALTRMGIVLFSAGACGFVRKCVSATHICWWMNTRWVMRVSQVHIHLQLAAYGVGYRYMRPA